MELCKCGGKLYCKKMCRRCYHKEYQNTHKNTIKYQHRSYQISHKEEINKYQREWRRKNPEKVKKIIEKRKKEHPESLKKHMEDYRNKHKKEIKKKQIEYRKNNKEKVNSRSRQYYLHLRTPFCAYCGSKENLQFHHTNYEKDEGFTLCASCHNQLHKCKKREHYNKINIPYQRDKDTKLTNIAICEPKGAINVPKKKEGVEVNEIGKARKE